MLYYYYIINRDVKQNISLATRITRNLLDKHEAYVQIRQASYCRTRKNFTRLILINQVNWLYHEAKTFQYYKGVQLLISHQLSIVQKLQCLKQRQHHLQVLFRLRSGNSRRLTNQSTISRSAAPSRAPSVPSSPGYSSADDSRLLYWYAAQTVENLLPTLGLMHCEAHVKVMSLDGKRIFIPDGVTFRKFLTIQQAIAWIK